jgi:hypothetical protein
MRRLALVLGVSVLLVLGFGAAFVLAGGLNGKQSIHITICHSGSGNKFTEITPENMKETYGGGYTCATKFHGDRHILRRSSWRG